MNKYKKGSYVEYPCVNGCGHHMRLKDDIDKLDSANKAMVECPTCGIEREHLVGEIRNIFDYQHNLGCK